MILEYCKKCEHHETVELDSRPHSRCLKENCLSIYTKCVADAAVQQFIAHDTGKKKPPPRSALEICYESV
ncbi:MAG: hypothetical protein JRJ12_16510 [Deltaproteobacteria bacterium]|nr:hypothetical protein [Deltaproteobacteria bacterium]